MASKKHKAPLNESDGVATRKAKAPRASKQATAPATAAETTIFTQVDAPRQAVFNTAELLENIILQLPVKSVYSAYRVCTQWKALVNTSKAIKEKLFLLSATPRKVWEFKEALTFTIARIFPAPDDTELSELPDEASIKSRTFLQPVKLHPLLVLMNHFKESAADRLNARTPERVSATLGRKVRMLARSLNAPSALGSTFTGQSPVLDAFITDPPCKVVRVIQHWLVKSRAAGWTRRDTVDCVVRSEDGITFRGIITSMHQCGRRFREAAGEPSDALELSMEDILQKYQDKGYHIVRRDPKVTVELCSNVVPSERLWQLMQRVALL